MPRPAPVSPQFASVHPFWSGMLGGFVGAGLAGMLFGHGFAPIGLSPAGATLGLLLQLALIGGLVWWGLRRLRGY
jgi:predicted lipid-binding transport protein (Tim44 family)